MASPAGTPLCASPVTGVFPGRELSRRLLSPSHGTETSLFDHAYLTALGERNKEVEEHFISYFSRPIRLKLSARLRSADLVQDAFQETFLRVLNYFQSGKTLDKPGSLPAFVHSVCHNVSLECIRGNTRYAQLPEHHQGPVDPGLDPQLQLVTAERKAMVGRLLGELSELDRKLLRRVFLDEEDKDVVCRELQVNRGYLRVLLFRARERLKTVIFRDAEANVAAGRSSSCERVRLDCSREDPE